MLFELLLIRQAIVLAGSGAAAYTDARAGLILDKITYTMIAAGILLNVFQQEWVWIAVGAVVFAIGYAVYYMGKIGGGDVKLFTGIAFLLPFYQGQFFLLNALFAACILAVVFYSVYYLLKYAGKGIDLKENKQGICKAILFGVVIGAWLGIVFITQVVSITALGILGTTLVLALLFLAFEKGIRRQFFLKKIHISKLEEDEVIATEFLKKEVREKLGLKFKGVFGEEEKAKLKKLGVTKVPVYRNMPPFGPFILLGCIAAMIWPDIIGLIFA